MSAPTATEYIIAGSEAASVLRAVSRRLSSPGQWSPDAWATLADGTPIADHAELHRAARMSVTAAIEASTEDLGLQEASCRALREAADAAGLRCSLRRIDEQAGHGVLMMTLQAAIALARSRPWPVRSPVELPERTPTLAEYRELSRTRDLITRRFFASERHRGEQFDATRAMAVARFDQQSAITAYFERHAATIDTLVSARQRSTAMRTRLTSAVRSLRRIPRPATTSKHPGSDADRP
jgi:hypothetical protein